MKKTIALLGTLIYSLIINAQNATDDFTGKWKAPKGAIIIISILDDAFIGKTEKENTIVLTNVKFLEGKWQAIILNPQENIIAKCELILYPTKLKIIAYKGIFSKTLYWIKQ